MTINAFMVAQLIAVAGVSVLAWCKRKNVGGKIWAVRTVPPCLLVAGALKLPFGSWLLFAFVTYAVAAYFGGWRLQSPRNAILRWIWWMVHVFVYLLMVTVGYAIVCTVLSIAVVSMPSTKIGPIVVNTESQWTRGRISNEWPFAVEYKVANAIPTEYDKRILFKSGKRMGLPIDYGGHGPYRVYRLKSGDYCLVDGFGLPKSHGDPERYLRVNVAEERVELKFGGGWFVIPENGVVCGWGGGDDLQSFSFDMYPCGDLNAKHWSVPVIGKPVGDSLEGMELLGTIETDGRFVPAK